jgi:hypothetical protein|tara:strand:- start:10650 stop:11273 length:624 start_codon:yes stop_codon:yes gene_type:complete
MTYVYLKLNAFADDSTDLTLDTIPLRVTNVNVNIQRTVPSFAIPLSSLATGESITIGADLGMASKSLTITGFLVDAVVKRSHTTPAAGEDYPTFTAVELAQLIASSVDSSGIAEYQNINELIVLIDSNVDENYQMRTNPTQIPLTFAARGSANRKDNERVPFPSAFPENMHSKGITGFIESFDFTLDAESPTEVSFNMSFKQATVFP